jgi:hypothetical protein
MRASNLPASPCVLNDSTATLARRLASDPHGLAPVPRLLVEGHSGLELRLDRQSHSYRIGRSAGCDLVVADDDMSREHAEIEHRWDGVFVRDCGSKNGVLVRGERLNGERRLADGDVVAMGRTLFVLDDPSDRHLRQLQDGAPELASSHDKADLADTNTAARVMTAEPRTRGTPTLGRMRIRPSILLTISVVVLVATVGFALSLLLAR